VVNSTLCANKTEKRTPQFSHLTAWWRQWHTQTGPQPQISGTKMLWMFPKHLRTCFCV